MGRAADAGATTRILRESFATGLAAYRAQDWGKAKTAFSKCLETAPEDRPSQTFLAPHRHAEGDAAGRRLGRRLAHVDEVRRRLASKSPRSSLTTAAFL